MGRIKTQQVKRITNQLFEKYKEKFSNNFEENKAVLNKVASVHSKKIRNTIAGYLTRMAQQQA